MTEKPPKPSKPDIALRLHRLLEAAPDGILEVNHDGAIVSVNAEAERLFLYTRAELVGMKVDKLLPDRFRGQHLAHRHRYSAHPTARPMGTGLDLFARRKDGSEFSVDIKLSPVEGDGAGTVLCVVRDVSATKKAAEEIRRLNQWLELRNREVERANRLKSEFLASMSHELRTPLNSIIGFADLLAEQTSETLGERHHRFINHIQEAARHLLSLINDILDLSRIEAGRLDLQHEEFEIQSALKEVLASIRPMAQERRITITNLSTDNVRLWADRVRFKEILFNLLSNAIKFTPSEGKVWIQTQPGESDVTFSVIDTGVGIPRDEQEAVFQSFHQTGVTAKGVREGTGLGLAITRKLVEHHGGRIWLESEPGAGARFHFTLPLGP